MIAWMLAGTAMAAPAGFGAGYYAHTLSHPGLAADARFPLRDTERWDLTAEAGGSLYWHVRDEVGLTARGALSAQRATRRGGYHEVALGLGAHRATWAAPTYQPDGSRAWLAGDSYGLAMVGVGGGKGPWFVRPELSARFPHAHTVGLDFAVYVGVRR